MCPLQSTQKEWFLKNILMVAWHSLDKQIVQFSSKMVSTLWHRDKFVHNLRFYTSVESYKLRYSNQCQKDIYSKRDYKNLLKKFTKVILK